jgi:hypothetical protein
MKAVMPITSLTNSSALPHFDPAIFPLSAQISGSLTEPGRVKTEDGERVGDSVFSESPVSYLIDDAQHNPCGLTSAFPWLDSDTLHAKMLEWSVRNITN